MTTFIYGTKNPAKLQSMKNCLAPLNIQIVGLNEIGADIPDVGENGSTPLENARIKALAYYAALKRPVFACDSGLYIDGLPEEKQPGIHVRIVGGKRLNDDEMVEHYAGIANALGGKAVARYKNAICLVMGESEIYEHFGDDISGDEFCLVDKPHEKRIDGFPLDCISVHIETGEYYYWHDRDNDAGMMFKGFQAFFRRVLEDKMFNNVQNRLSEPTLRHLISGCLFDSSSAGIDDALARYEGEQFYAWEVDGKPMGICGFRIFRDKLEICHIAVSENAHGKGYGNAMIAALRDKYNMSIQAETDDDAVDFYRKCGFEATAINKQYGDNTVRRWICVLETDEQRRSRIYPIILSTYNPEWPEWYEEEKANLERLIGAENISRISHFGSTSVPDLTAKPTVDILIEIKNDTDLEALIAALPSQDYICLRQEGNSLSEHDLVMIIKGYLSDGFAEKVYHIHVRHAADWDELQFRDYLIAHPETAAEYAALKRGLFANYERDRDGYTDAKGAFILKVTEMAKEGK